MNQDTDDLTDLCPLIDPVTALSKLGLRKNLHVLLGRLCSSSPCNASLTFCRFPSVSSKSSTCRKLLVTQSLLLLVDVTRYAAWATACYTLAANRSLEMIMSSAAWLSPTGTITSACCFDGSTNFKCIGRTVFMYCLITESVLLPLSFMSRVRRRIKRTSSAVSTKMRMSMRSRSCSWVKMRIPSTRMICLGSTLSVTSVRLWVLKSYVGTSTALPDLS
mmetsp:Transcript_47778/g.89011  ORF Transcript_47778/g.89011 Transcript_47778/m.89011 type:complete len:219 (+) Transcript_47778:133-789(+)